MKRVSSMPNSMGAPSSKLQKIREEAILAREERTAKRISEIKERRTSPLKHSPSRGTVRRKAERLDLEYDLSDSGAADIGSQAPEQIQPSNELQPSTQQISPRQPYNQCRRIISIIVVILTLMLGSLMKLGQARISSRLEAGYKEPINISRLMRENTFSSSKNVLDLLERGRPYVLEIKNNKVAGDENSKIKEQDKGGADGGSSNTLSFALWGSGKPQHHNNVVVYFAGLGGSRMEHFHLDSDDRVLLTIDKPGMGFSKNSDENKDMSLEKTSRYVDVAESVFELLTLLKVNQFDVVGWSSGGPYALALTHKAQAYSKASTNKSLEQPLLHRSSIVAADPMWSQSSLSTMISCPHHLFMYYGIKLINRKILGYFILKTMELLSGYETELDLLVTPKHDKVLRRTNRNFAESIRQGYQGALAIADDVYQERSPDWGFELKDIQFPVRVFHSPNDFLVPYQALEQYRSELPNTFCYRLPPYHLSDFEEGHFIMINFWSMIVNDGESGHEEAAKYLL